MLKNFVSVFEQNAYGIETIEDWSFEKCVSKSIFHFRFDSPKQKKNRKFFKE